MDPTADAISAFLALVRDVGLPVALLLLAIVTGARGIWLWGWQHRAWIAYLERDRDQWRELALGGREIALQSTRLLDRVVNPRPKD